MTTARLKKDDIAREYGRKMSLISKIFLVTAVLSVVGALSALIFVPDFGFWVYGFMGLTVLFFVLWIVTAFPHLKSYVGRRSTRLGFNSVVMTLVVLALLVGIYYIAAQNEVQKDLTRDRIHSLSEQTLKVLANLKDEVIVTTFVTAEVEPAIKAALERYLVHTNKIQVNYVSLTAQPEVVRAYRVTRANAIVFESSTRESRIESVTTERLEEQITNAIIRVSKDGAETLCFLTGHGEPAIYDHETDGLTAFVEGLGHQRYEAKPVNLLEVPSVPTTCAVLMIVGPQTALFDAEAEALAAYIDARGKTAVFVDPYIDDSWARFLARWGVDVKLNMVVVEHNPLAQAFGASPVMPTIGNFDGGSHLFADFRGNMVLNMAAPVLAMARRPDNVTVTEVARTTANSWGETSDLRRVSEISYVEGVDLAGPVSVAVEVAIEPPLEERIKKRGDTDDEDDIPMIDMEPAEVSLIVFGNSKFLNNDFSRYVNNMDVGLNVAAFLAQDDELVSIRPRERGATPLELTNMGMRVLYGLNIILFPFAFFFLAGMVYLRRRSR